MIIPQKSLNLNLATIKPSNPNHFIKFAPTQDHILCNQISKDSGIAPNVPTSWNLMSLYCETKHRAEPEHFHLQPRAAVHLKANGHAELIK